MSPTAPRFARAFGAVVFGPLIWFGVSVALQLDLEVLGIGIGIAFGWILRPVAGDGRHLGMQLLAGALTIGTMTAGRGLWLYYVVSHYDGLAHWPTPLQWVEAAGLINFESPTSLLSSIVGVGLALWLSGQSRQVAVPATSPR